MEPASTYNEDNARKELKFEKYLKPTVPFQIGALKVNGFNVILRGKIVENALPLDSDNLKVNELSMEGFNGIQICQISPVNKQDVNKVIVGDPNLQIYRFRGAINALGLVESTHLYHLTQSFPFGPNIGLVANSCLEHN